MAKRPIKDKIHAKGFDITVYTEDFKNEYISLTDIARYKSDEPFIVINNWMRRKDTIEFLGLWEQLHNQDFKPIEFDRFRKEAGYNAFTLSPQKWIKVRMQTDAIKENLIPPELSSYQIYITYASEADLLNVALFGVTAKQWRDKNPEKSGNIRDYATLNQLLVLSNMESYNAILIEQGKPQADRLQLLNSLAIRQVEVIKAINTDLSKILEDK